LFGAAPLTGSIGVCTINMPRIGYLSKTKKEYFERLAHLMDLAKESLEIKRKTLENFIEKDYILTLNFIFLQSKTFVVNILVIIFQRLV